MPANLTIGVLTAWQVYEGTGIDGYLRALLDGIRAAARDRGCNLLLACGVAPPSPPRLMVSAWPFPMPDTQFVPVGPWNTDGLIVVPDTLSPERLRHVQEMMIGGHPVVFAGFPELSPSVAVDNAGGIERAVEHLAAHGHRRIAFIGHSPQTPGDVQERLRAYQAAIGRTGLDADPRLIAFGEQADDVESGQSAVDRILGSGARFTALIAFNDWLAIGALKALRSAGLDTPRDVAVIGFDDRLEARIQTPPLTTIRHPTFDLGYQSLLALLDLRKGTWDGRTCIRIPTQLLIRQSCGCGIGAFSGDGRAAGESGSVTGPSVTAEEMAGAAAAEARHLPVGQLTGLCQELVTALSTALASSDATPFMAALAQVLEQTETLGEDTHIWHHAISALQMDSLRLRSALGPEFREALFDQAHVCIAEQARRQETRVTLDETMTADRLGLMTAHLLTALDASRITEILAEHLPPVGIRRMTACLYSAEEDDPVANSEVVLSVGAGSPTVGLQFVTRRFPPSGLLKANEPFQLAVLPLIIQDEVAGLIAFEAENLEPCAVIMRNVAAALRSTRLYQEATEGRRLAEDANRVKSRFLSTVSHELRTPLNVIVGLSKLILSEQARGANPALQDLERIYSSAEHLGFLIRDVLDLASSDAGQLRLTCEALDLVQVIKPVAATGELLARDKGLAWQVQLPESSPPIWGDRTRLRQVALNFISNAVKFTDHGEITIRVAAAAGEVTCSVADTGLGVPPQEQESIFDEFGQSERTTARGYGGLGLGLAISKHLIELHGGRIGVLSSGVEGAGATFFFSLPVMAQLSPGDAIGLPALQAVLLISDQTDTSDRVSAHLRSQGYEITAIKLGAGHDWLSQVRQAGPSAILLDARLSSPPAWEVVQALRKDKSVQGVRVLFFALEPEAGTGGVLELDFRHKPLDGDQVTGALALGAEKEHPVILIVDDDPGILSLHTRLVKQQLPGCQVFQARNGREAISSVERCRPDLVLLDLMMPELDGFGVLERLQEDEETRRIPVVVLTARVLDETDLARLNRGVVSILEKGVLSEEEALARVVDTLGRRPRPGTTVHHSARKAMAFIHEHYAEPITREQIADYAGVSEGYLANCFHHELGISPMVYLNRYRIRQARRLLQAGELNITEVGLGVGFSDSAYFSRVFQREVGVSPRLYRKGVRAQP